MVIGILMGLFPLFHIHKIYRCQSSIGQHLVAVTLWELGIATWLIYGILKRDSAIVIANWTAVGIGLLYLLRILNMHQHFRLLT